MAAATLLCDMIQGRDNPYAGLFSPSRLDPAALPGILTEGGQAVKSMVKRFFQIPAEAAKDIPAGHGGIVFLNGKKAGVYRDKSGALHPVDIRCPHLGCQLEWDPDEKTWDCPCHGSRFDCLGRLISGPAGGLYRHQSSGLHNDRSGSEGLVPPLYQPGRSAGVRIFGGCPPDVSALHGLGPAARPLLPSCGGGGGGAGPAGLKKLL